MTKNNNDNTIDKIARDLLMEVSAINKGHFKLSSGNHSDTYFQMANVFKYPSLAEKIIRLFIQKNEIKSGDFDVIVTPAMGGILVGYELSRQLRIPNIFFERVNGVFTLKRGFDINQDSRILLLEDVITTGKSYREITTILSEMGFNGTISVGCLIDRSINIPVDYNLIRSIPQIWTPEECPLCKSGVDLTVNGSRWN